MSKLYDYLKEKKGYVIHISNLEIFDEPKGLNEFYCKRFDCFTTNVTVPQNMCYCFDDKDNEYVLISIRPEWVKKILNGEKTIEIRKKILSVFLRYL